MDRGGEVVVMGVRSAGVDLGLVILRGCLCLGSGFVLGTG